MARRSPQTNYGGILEIDGVQVGQRLEKHDFINHVKKSENVDGSCMMVVITDAPLDSRNLERLAKRAMMGMAKTGGIASNGSGDYVIAMSVAPGNLIDSKAKTITSTVLANSEMSSLFAATIEATAEALWNSLFMAEPMTGRGGYHVDALPIDKQMTDKDMYYILLDEIQFVPEFEDVLNSYLNVKNAEVFVTGSNAKFLSKDVITEFRGRGWEIRVHPLSFTEYYETVGGEKAVALEEYYLYGGLPQVAQMSTPVEKENYLREIFETVYLKDVIERNHSMKITLRSS